MSHSTQERFGNNMHEPGEDHQVWNVTLVPQHTVGQYKIIVVARLSWVASLVCL